MFYVLNLIAAINSRLDEAKDRGATATEYAILITVIALVVVTGAAAFGTQLSDWFSSLSDKIGLTVGGGK